MFDFFKKPTPQEITPTPAPTPTPEKVVESSINPLDEYNKLFEKSLTTEDVDEPPPFALDEGAVENITSKLNFLDPELLAKAKEGDTEALIALINRSNQKAYKAALSHAVALTNTHLGARDKIYQKSLGKGVKQNLVQQEISSANNHPLIKAELTRIAGMIAKENPDASPAEIAAQAKTYFNEIHNAMNPAPKKEQTRQVDLAAFLGM